MAFPSFVNRIVPTSDSSARSKPLEQQPRVLLIPHHAATTSLSQILSLFQPGGRTVSATFAIGNTGEIVGCVDPSRRPWTSASKLDDIAITFECANLSTTGWTISDASYAAIAKIAAWMDRVYPGFSIDRDHIVGHGELYTRWRESYATACPGGMDMDRIVREARALRQSEPASIDQTPITIPRTENNMLMIHKTTANDVLYAIFAPGFWLEFTGQDAASGFAAQIGAKSVLVSQGFWDHCRKASGV